jgi:hypothetical protein
VGGIASMIEQLVEDHTELRQGFKNLQMAVKATNLIKKIKVRNRSNKYNIHFFGFSFTQLQGRLAVNDVKRYFEILEEFHTGQTSIVKMVEEVPIAC